MLILKCIGIGLIVFYFLMCWINMIDNDSNTHEPADGGDNV